jgi:hypothetical protein
MALRDWEAIERLLSIYKQLLDHPKLKSLLDEVERELETLQEKDNGERKFEGGRLLSREPMQIPGSPGYVPDRRA